MYLCCTHKHVQIFVNGANGACLSNTFIRKEHKYIKERLQKLVKQVFMNCVLVFECFSNFFIFSLSLEVASEVKGSISLVKKIK